MRSEQTDLARRAYAEIRKAEIPTEGLVTDKDLSAALAAAGVVDGAMDLVSRSVSGFTIVGLREVERLAASIRAMSDAGANHISNATLARVIGKMLIRLWQSKSGAPPTTSDLEEIGGAIEAWSADQKQARTHFVPCNLSPDPWGRFEIGPVLFYPIRETAAITDNSISLDLQKEVLEAAQARGHSWMAQVEVHGREKEQSIRTADQCVDIALGIYQLVLTDSEFAVVARATDLSAPMLRNDVWSQNGNYVGARSVAQPGRSYHPAVIARIIRDNRAILDSMGRRLSGYHHGTSSLPTLDSAWCNAAYWYHATLAEPLETIAIVGFETTIEVLLANSNGSTQRIVEAFVTLLGLAADEPVGSTGLNVKEFSAALVTARSRVLHGSWPTLHPDMPGARGGIAISRQHAETLARSLLLRASEAIDLYAATPEATDTIQAFLTWCGSDLPPTSMLNRAS